MTLVSSDARAAADRARRERQVDDGVDVGQHRGIRQRVGASEVDEAVLDLGVLAVGRTPIEGEDGVDVGRFRQEAHDPPADGARGPGHDHTLHALTLARRVGSPPLAAYDEQVSEANGPSGQERMSAAERSERPERPGAESR